MEHRPLSVFQLNSQIKSILEDTFLSVCVEGEISNITHHSSGHIYFNIKDSQSAIACVLFRGNAQFVDIALKNGLQVIVYGGISVYPPRGNYQILCKKIIASDIGNLFLQYEQLKHTLQAKGYFDTKKPIPAFPKRVILITSSTGAALQDMLRVAQSRWNLLEFLILDTLMQGENAKYQVAQHIAYADTLQADVIVLARGGGSMQDLWTFNEECVADAIFQAQTPIVSAIGHQSDVLLSDFVADLRAPTPSACIEMILPQQTQWLYKIADLRDFLSHKIEAVLQSKTSTLQAMLDYYRLCSYEEKLKNQHKTIEQLRKLLDAKMHFVLQEKLAQLLLLAPLKTLNPIKIQEQILNNLSESFKLCDPTKHCHNGYAQITQNGRITALQHLKLDTPFELTNSETSKKAQLLPED
ncbi:exodeoxyribonuclease VII large subunit [Helicobacter enhydrae]|uniref:Exodeoxyribonuclease 7 large subunit n=1 Tax=Helicobacter enhydrae TaxID=222136 RepID=A0A1B1U743_9HELI|nr:exodeoxyribonuclease VII large subunit [Helicobacter enhydrae]ANV98603.1 exodeoxyribonuclease VII large subunit [Helicobacter enhydrae]